MDEEQNRDPDEPEVTDGNDDKDSEPGPEEESSKDDDGDKEDENEETALVDCVNDGHGPAQAFCMDCAKFYCSECSVGHQRYDFIRSHTIKELDTMSNAEIVEAKVSSPKRLCSLHKDYVFTLYCTTCKEPVCTTCCLSTHKYHDYKALEEAGREIHARLVHILDSTEDYIARQKGVLLHMGATESKIQTDFDKSRKGVDALIGKVRRLLCEDIDSKEAEVLERLRSARQEVQTSKEGALEFKSYLAELCRSHQAITKLEAVTQAEATFRRQESKTLGTIRWKFSYDEQQMSEDALRAMLGSVRLRTSPVGFGGEHASIILTLDTPFDTLKLEYSGKKVVSGMVVMDNYLYVTHAREPFLWVRDLNKNSSAKVKVCDVPELERAMGMAVTRKPNTVAISDRGNSGGKLHFVTIVNLEVAAHHVFYIPLKLPRSVTVSEDTGHVLVGQEGKLEFGVFSTDTEDSLQLLKKVTLSVTAAQASFCDVWQVTKLAKGYYALVWNSKYGGNVWWLDEEGRVTQDYDKDSMHAQSLKRPYSSVRDGQGRILVTDHGSDRLQVIGSNKKFQQFLLTKRDGLRSPACLYLDEEAATLYVAHGGKGSREISMYRWPQLVPPGESRVTDFELSVHLGKFL